MTFATALGPIPSVDSPTAASVPSGPVRMTAMKPPSRAQGHGGRSLRPTVAEQIEEALEQMREDPPPSEPRRKILQATEVHFTKPESETGLTAEMLSFYRETLWQLLRPEEGQERMPLRGFLGQALRGNGEFRGSLLRTGELEGQKIWVQLDRRRHRLGALTFLENFTGAWRPQRVLLGCQILRYDESQEPVVFDLEFVYPQGSRASSPEIHARVYKEYADGNFERDEYLSQRFSPEPAKVGKGLHWRLYPKSSYQLDLTLAAKSQLPLNIIDLYLHSMLTVDSKNFP